LAPPPTQPVIVTLWDVLAVEAAGGVPVEV
jgi:hypothetical protein